MVIQCKACGHRMARTVFFTRTGFLILIGWFLLSSPPFLMLTGREGRKWQAVGVLLLPLAVASMLLGLIFALPFLFFLEVYMFSVDLIHLGRRCPHCRSRGNWQWPTLDNSDFPRE